jgi:hypothetical protein
MLNRINLEISFDKNNAGRACVEKMLPGGKMFSCLQVENFNL